MLLDDLGHGEAAARVRAAVAAALLDPDHHTADLGGRATTTDLASAVLDRNWRKHCEEPAQEGARPSPARRWRRLAAARRLGQSGSGSEGTRARSSDDQLTIGLVAEPANLDFTTTDGAAIPQALLYNVYENLVEVDQDGEIVPALAESWDISEDRKTYTFHLVESATFSNGEEPSPPRTPSSPSSR